MVYQLQGYFTQRNPSDRPNLILPEHWIEHAGSFGSIDEIARPMLDTLFQCFDMERSLFYDQSGDWNASW